MCRRKDSNLRTPKRGVLQTPAIATMRRRLINALPENYDISTSTLTGLCSTSELKELVWRYQGSNLDSMSISHVCLPFYYISKWDPMHSFHLLGPT